MSFSCSLPCQPALSASIKTLTLTPLSGPYQGIHRLIISLKMFMHPPISIVMQTALTALMEGASNASVVVVLTWLIVRVSVKIPVSMIVE